MLPLWPDVEHSSRFAEKTDANINILKQRQEITQWSASANVLLEFNTCMSQTVERNLRQQRGGTHTNTHAHTHTHARTHARRYTQALKNDEGDVTCVFPVVRGCCVHPLELSPAASGAAIAV